MLFRTGALIGALSLLTMPAFAAPPRTQPAIGKPAVIAKSAVSKAAPAKPAAPQVAPPVQSGRAAAAPKTTPAAAAPKTVYKLPTGGSAAKPTGAQANPAPAAAAAPAAAKPAVQAAKPKAKKVAKKSGKKKKRVAKAKKGKARKGEDAASPLASVDQAQLSADHLAGAESKSTLDLLASYKATLRDGDLETAGVLLRLIVNERPRHEVATAVNDLLGVPLNTQETEVLIEIARADRADAVADAAVAKGDEKVASPLGERIHAAHAAVEAAPRTSRLDALAAYKQAVTEENSEAAAVALSGVVQAPIDEAAVQKANALLGVKNIISPGQIAAAN